MNEQLVDIFASFATDLQAEEKGAEVKIAGETFRIARIGNRKYSRLMEEAVDQHRQAMDAASAEEAEKLSESILIDVLSQSILLGWGSRVAFKGQQLEYSIENAKTLLGVKDFRAAVLKHADRFETFKVKAEAAQGKD